MKKIAFIVSLLFLIACNHQDTHTIKFTGEAQGTTYQVTYLTNENITLQNEIDSILKKIDQSLSPYLPTSIITAINNNDTSVKPDAHFIHVFNRAQEIAQQTNGAFDVTVAPLINAWGFGFTKKETIDSAKIDSLLKRVNYKMVTMREGRVKKYRKDVMIDFNAIAQGYTVDVLGAFLESRNISNYLVELGGEVRAKGKNEKGDHWKIGIDRPDEKQSTGRPLTAIIELQNKSLATSGNYRKFYIEDGKKYAHIINPATGYPAKNNLLSATVVAADCMTADAFATAFMVMGLEASKKFLAQNPGLRLEVFFIYDSVGQWRNYTSPQMHRWIQLIN